MYSAPRRTIRRNSRGRFNLAGWLPGWLACLLARLLACLVRLACLAVLCLFAVTAFGLAGLLACLPAGVLEEVLTALHAWGACLL